LNYRIETRAISTRENHLLAKLLLEFGLKLVDEAIEKGLWASYLVLSIFAAFIVRCFFGFTVQN